MNRFEQLIEYVINDEEQKARELFHDIVVEKSRQIYENLMAEETKDEELDETKDEELDETKDEELDEAMGGDASDDLIDEIEADEEQDVSMEAEEEEEVEIDADMDSDDDHHADIGGEEELEDRVMDLEDKLDELMSEFEALMSGDDMGDGDDFGPGEGGDAIEMDDTEEMMPEMGTMPMPMEEAVSLKAAPKPVTSEESGINKKSTVAANAGARGAMAEPVKMTGDIAQGRPAPATKDLITDFQNKAGTGMKDQKAAPKPVTTQAAGVNTRTPFPKG